LRPLSKIKGILVRIVVCIKEVVDAGLNLAFGRVSTELWQKGLAFLLNPNDVGALAAALEEKSKDARVEITVISLGPERVEDYLREALALGANSTVHLQTEDQLSPYQKATALSLAVSRYQPDLILTGAASLDNASGQVGPSIAARLGLPCVVGVTEFQLDGANRSATVTRSIGRGVRERLLSPVPAVLTIEGPGRALPYASLDKLLESRAAPITVLSLSDLGISATGLAGDPTRVTGLSFPRPRPKKVPTPASSLPAFDRILKLLEGGIPKRQGKMLHGSRDELVNQLFDLLVAADIISQTEEKGAAK
jgi:electron transfer flavoprotein beta subunit